MSNIKKRPEELGNIDLTKILNSPSLKTSSELIFLGNPINPKIELSNNEKELLKACSYKKISEVEEEILEDITFICITNALRTFGSKMTPEDRVVLNNDFMFEINMHFPNMTIGEFAKILELGIRNKLTEDTIGLTVRNFNLWSKEWFKRKNELNKSILNKMKNISTAHLLPPGKVTLKDIHQIFTEDYNSLFELYSRTIKNQSKNKSTLFDQESKISFNEYYIENGLLLSAQYVFRKLVELKELTEEDCLKKIKKISKNDFSLNIFSNLAPLSKNSKEYQIVRKICVSYFLEKQ